MNATTISGNYPISHIHDFTNSLHGCSIFYKVDLVRAYKQTPVRDEDICRIAITTPFSTKCVFGVLSLEYLGHIIDREGIRPIPDKVEAIFKIPVPNSLKQLRRSLGL